MDPSLLGGALLHVVGFLSEEPEGLVQRTETVVLELIVGNEL